MVVGSLSVIPLLASFYPLAYYAKDFDDRKDICDVFETIRCVPVMLSCDVFVNTFLRGIRDQSQGNV